MREWISFLGAAAGDPQGIGAIAPSGGALARAMVDAARIEAGHRVVELGAGTGPVTRALVAARPDASLLVLEPDAALAARCRAAVPGVQVVEAMAQELPALIEAQGWSAVDRVVSSLPFAVWPVGLQDEVLDAVLNVLVPGGVMVTFTYVQSPLVPAGRRFRRTLERRFARVTTTPIVWLNLPPAFVYVCETLPAALSSEA
jgi:phosphatidylethanolamine/phosphatidyl-N-methylethanolamine N-methyltransferase